MTVCRLVIGQSSGGHGQSDNQSIDGLIRVIGQSRDSYWTVQQCGLRNEGAVFNAQQNGMVHGT